MSLVSSKEIAKAIGVDKYGFVGTSIGWTLMKVLRISKLNKLYDKHKDKACYDFLKAVLNDLQVDYEIPEKDLKRIPKEGPFITISNHPLGGLDGIILLRLIMERRADFKVIANFLLHRIAPMKPYIMAVNPFESHKDVKSSVGGIKEALSHLKSGQALGVFPAGEVSTLGEGDIYIDRPWEESALKLIKKAQVPVIPIYFHAKNSRSFYSLSKLSETLRTAKLPSELYSQKGKKVKIRIGKPITVKDQEPYSDIKSFGEFLRRKTYMLSNAYDKQSKHIPTPTIKISRGAKDIVNRGDLSAMEKEILSLRTSGARFFEIKNYEVFFASADQMPNLLQEIGRLREISFRAVGEGTNNATDLDSFDQYYHHLFLWDKEASQLVGAYRMGLGVDIYKAKGISGFYVQTLFKFDQELHKMMSETIDMGRAFIVQEYQQKPLPLFYLWKGIVHVTLRYPDHKYIIGGVSISNQFSNFSKSLMIEFMKSHYYDPYIAQYVRPKKEYKVKLKDADKEFVFDSTKSDLNKFDKVIDELEPGNLRLPVLIKKYIKQNAKLVAFNVDPKFNNAIDGLFLLTISDLPESTVQPVIEEFQAEILRKSEGN